MTESVKCGINGTTNPVLTVARSKEDFEMIGATEKTTALYCRLSQEDERLGESLSIENQKNMLERYAKEHRFPRPVFYVDDGYSGTTFDRPGFQKMISDIEAGKVGICLSKDLSRLGRNSAMVGLYTNITFAKYGVRYIAINDNFDTIDPNSHRKRDLQDVHGRARPGADRDGADKPEGPDTFCLSRQRRQKDPAEAE